jgi:hypothetical protein
LTQEGTVSLYKNRIAEGLCGACGKEPLSSKSLGLLCLEKSRVKTAKRRAANAEKGKCACGTKLAKGKKKCPLCVESAKASRLKSTDKKKALGICVKSGCKNPAKPGCVVCQLHIDEDSARSSERYKTFKAAGLCPFCGDPPIPDESVCAYHKEKYRDYRLAVKMDALAAYGCVCAVCGCNDVEILEINHIDGGGGAHRREVSNGLGGYSFYLWLKREAYPEGFNVLCPTHNKKAYIDSLKKEPPP